MCYPLHHISSEVICLKLNDTKEFFSGLELLASMKHCILDGHFICASDVCLEKGLLW